MDYARQFIYAANPLRLSLRQWLVAGALLAILMAGVPWFARRREPFVPGPDYRLPYDFSQDYWHCSRWIAAAARRDAVLVLGDSVVWGEYVAAPDSLSGQLNRLARTERFANLGLNGLHPAALLGLLRHHGGALRDRDVVLVLNLLWLSSARHDLRGGPETEGAGQALINHAGLLPQFWPRVPGYGAGFEERAANAAACRIPFLAWARHVSAAGTQARRLAEGSSAAAGTAREPRIDDPTPAAFRGLLVAVPPPAPGPHGQPLTWTARGIPVSRIAWPQADRSPQWRLFRQAVQHLQARGNRVCVLVAPFNPYIQEAESRGHYESMVTDMVAWLAAQEGLAVIRCEPLPGPEYADASHPLAAGYARLAAELAADPRFRPWFGTGGQTSPARQ